VVSSLTPLQTHPPKRTRVARPSVIVECAQPPDVVAAFLSLLHRRRREAEERKGHQWVLRDLHEEAIKAFVEDFQAGIQHPILAISSIDQVDRKTFRIDATLRASVVQIARARRATHGEFYYNAFLRYLMSQGVLADTGLR